MARINRQWILRRRPQGLIQPGDLELVEAPVTEPGRGRFWYGRSTCLWTPPTAPG
jgi:hypothetical protein